jgi:hypothetical protein
MNGVKEKVALEWGLIGSKTGIFSDDVNVKQASHYLRQPPELDIVSLFRKHHMDQVDFLKMDIEGSEFALFEDHEAWLPRVKAMSMEIHLDYGSVDGVLQLLRNNGFEVYYQNRASGRPQAMDRIGFLFARRVRG